MFVATLTLLVHTNYWLWQKLIVLLAINALEFSMRAVIALDHIACAKGATERPVLHVFSERRCTTVRFRFFFLYGYYNLIEIRFTYFT